MTPEAVTNFVGNNTRQVSRLDLLQSARHARADLVDGKVDRFFFGRDVGAVGVGIRRDRAADLAHQAIVDDVCDLDTLAALLSVQP